MIWEIKRHEEDMDVLSAKLRFQQNDLSTLVHEKSVVETKLLELDQLVGQLLLVNESLVIRLSGKPIPKTSSTNSTKKKKNIPQQLPRAAYTSTFSQIASNGVTANNNMIPGTLREEKSSLVTAAQDAEHLHQIHRMYVDLARNITEKHKGMSENDQFNTNGKESRSGLESTYEPGSLINQREKEISRQNLSGQAPSKMNPSVSFHNNDNYNNVNKNDIDNNYNYGDGNMKEREDKHNFDDSFHGNYSASFIGGSGNTPNRPSGIQGVISSLEEEFITLNDQYRHLLSSIKTQPSSQEIEKEEELVAIIQKLHKKGEQLRSLKSPTK